MKPLSDAELRAQIKKGPLAPVYFIYGDESYMKKHYVNQLIKKAVNSEDSFNFNRFDDSVSMQEIYDAVNQLPLMSDKKCAVVCDYNIEKAILSDIEKLKEIVSDRVDSCVLVFWFDSVVIDIKKATKAKKIAAVIEKSGGIVAEIGRKTGSELVRLLTDGSARRGCRMEPTVARYLIEVCSDDLQNLLTELEKLCAYASGESITADMIDKICIRSVDVSIFALSKALTAGSAEEAMKILDDLFYQRVEPVVILGTLAAPYVDMYRAKAAEAEGLRADAIANEFGYYGTAFRLKNASYSARKLNAEQLGSSLSILLEADGKLKSSRIDARTLLEQTMVRLVLAAKGGVQV